MGYQPKYFQKWESFPVLTDVLRYDPRTAWWAAQCSQLSYENKITIAHELQAAQFSDVTFFDSRGTQAFLAVHPGVGGGDFAILAFRGTEEDSIDILTDINFFKRLFPEENLAEKTAQEPEATQKKRKKPSKLYAHGGFLQGVLNVWGSALSKEITDIYPEAKWKGAQGISEALLNLEPGIAIYFTGHSLGGALATLAAHKAMVYQSSFQVTGLYTFGSPRTSQHDLTMAINRELGDRSYRVVNYIDVVPRLPPRIPFILQFHHIDHLIYFSQSHKHMMRKRSRLNILMADTGVLLLLILEIFLALITLKQYVPRTIQYHMIAKYVEDIEKEVGRLS